MMQLFENLEFDGAKNLNRIKIENLNRKLPLKLSKSSS